MNFKKKSLFYFISLFLFFLIRNLNCADIGSDFTIQSHIVFNYGEDNRIANDAVMENGFTLTARTITSDIAASCSYDSYFPVTGFTSLNGGKLYLNNDLKIDNIYALVSAGKIYGNGYSIIFPESENITGVPSSVDRGGRLTVVDDQALSGILNVDWSYDDKYIVMRTNRGEIYTFNGSVIGSPSYIFASGATSLKWHPSSYYCAAGVPDFAEVYYLDPVAGTITQTSIVSNPYDVNSCAWSWDGKYLIALATSNVNPNARVLGLYSFSQGALTYLTQIFVSALGPAQNNCLDCSPNSYNFVFGTDSSVTDILVGEFNASSLSITTSIHVPGATAVKSVSWKPEDNLIAAGISGSTENLRVYEFSGNTLTEKTKVSDSVTFNHVDWARSGNRLAVAKDSAATYEVEAYYFDKNTNNLNLIDGYADSVINYDAKFSNNGKYLAAARTNYGRVYKFNQNDMLFDNTNFMFNSDTEFIVTTTFSGKCTIKGNGNKIYLNEDASIGVASGGQLKLQNLELVGLDKTNLQCLADDASIILEDCKLTVTSDYTFGAGAILFKGDNVISGTNKFIYSVARSSTLDTNSMLYIDNGITFSYDPSVANRDLLHMQDNTSWLFLDGCTLNSTKTGMRLTRGKLFIDNLVTFNAEGSAISEIICFGNGIATDDLEVEILASADLNIYGKLEYKNTN